MTGHDIRAAALVIAALAAEDTTIIRGTYHQHRGYSHLLPQITALGAHLPLPQALSSTVPELAASTSANRPVIVLGEPAGPGAGR